MVVGALTSVEAAELGAGAELDEAALGAGALVEGAALESVAVAEVLALGLLLLQLAKVTVPAIASSATNLWCFIETFPPGISVRGRRPRGQVTRSRADRASRAPMATGAA
jgi:hypothetical protein